MSWLVCFGFQLLFDTKHVVHYVLYCSLSLPMFSLVAYVVEKLAYRKYLSEPVSVSSLTILNIANNGVTTKENIMHDTFGHNIADCCFPSHNHHHDSTFVPSFCDSQVYFLPFLFFFPLYFKIW